MNYSIFKTPRKKGDRPLETMSYEPNDFIIEQKAMKYGPIVILTEEELRKELKNE